MIVVPCPSLNLSLLQLFRPLRDKKKIEIYFISKSVIFSSFIGIKHTKLLKLGMFTLIVPIKKILLNLKDLGND